MLAAPHYRKDPVSGVRTLLAPYALRHAGVTFRFPTGHQWNGPSVPKLARSLVDNDELGEVAALLHDLLYGCGGRPGWDSCDPRREFTRAQADRAFLVLMLLDGCDPDTAFCAYKWVRRLGWLPWHWRRTPTTQLVPAHA